MNVPTWIMEKIVVADNGCWHWQGWHNSNGYGGCERLGERHAHRVVYRILIGPIPEGHDLDHMCHNDDSTCAGGRTCLHRRCVNPSHLKPATRRENLLRGNTIPAARARQKTCIHGHNRWGVRRSDGTRRCLECHRIAENARFHSKRGAA